MKTYIKTINSQFQIHTTNFTKAKTMKSLSLITIAVILGATAPAHAAVGNDKSASYVRDAEKYLKKGDVKAAIIQLKNAVVAEPKMWRTGLPWRNYI